MRIKREKREGNEAEATGGGREGEVRGGPR